MGKHWRGSRIFTVMAALSRHPGVNSINVLSIFTWMPNKIRHVKRIMRRELQYFVYILASKRNGTLYIGITSNLLDRVYKHKQGLYDGFTKKYKVDKLVYFEIFNDVRDAINREKQLKNWKRQWKIELIEKHNPTRRDLYYDL